MSVTKVCGVVLTALMTALILKKSGSGFGGFVSGTAGIFLLSVGIASLLPVLEYVSGLSQTGELSKYTVYVYKAVGIGLITELVAGLCRDSGENSLSEQVGFFGRAEILLLSLPLLRDAVGLAGDILK